MPRPLAVDPRFGPELRRLREERGLSVRELASAGLTSKTQIHDLETGRRRPTVATAAHLDRALNAGGHLAAMVREAGPPPESAERLAYVVQHPRRVDGPTLDALTDLLAAQRRLEDAVGSVAVLGPVRAQLGLVTGLVGEARCTLRPRLVDLASQWTQFAGWLHIAAGQDQAAARWLARALELATEVDNRDMVATALSFRAHLAEGQGRTGDMIGLSLAASRDPGVYPGLRAYCAGQSARGLATAGADAAEVLPLLSELRDLAAEQSQDDLPPSGYWYTDSFFAIQEGITLRHLAETDRRHATRAVELLAAGVAATPPESRGSDWHGRHIVQLGQALTLAGDQPAAQDALDRARDIATATGSRPLAAQITAAVRNLSAHR
ncbi:helix-turn-helix domain-containing protein [Plantactinospora sp. CA-290183]|uniref:helix-turn-helix domain-containing protein n=1 Tax=Plantactinospora sp. CA-290183 TaxID=3240006 RepID=UPI003D92B4ED